MNTNQLPENKLKEFQQAQIKNYVTRHKGTVIISKMIDDLNLTVDFFFRRVVCFKCGHNEPYSVYAVAQLSMHHEVTFTCKCGNKIDL